MKNDKPTIGSRIKAAREAAGVTQEVLAAAAGTHQTHVSRLENDAQEGTITVLKRLAKALGVDVRELIG